MVRRIPVEDFIVMKKQADNFRAVGVDPFVAGIAAPVIVVEKTVAEISVQHVIDACIRIHTLRFAETVPDAEQVDDRRGNPVIAGGFQKKTHVDLTEEFCYFVQFLR